MFCQSILPTDPGCLVPGGRMQLYGWDAAHQAWHGPNEMTLPPRAPRLAGALRRSPGSSWYGPVECGARGLRSRFFVLAHKLPDCGVAMIYCGESKAGPCEIVAVIPPGTRGRVRPDFAFELVSFAGFLRAMGENAALAVHDHVAGALAETDAGDTLVFSISSGEWADDQDQGLSECVEKVAAAMAEWLE